MRLVVLFTIAAFSVAFRPTHQPCRHASRLFVSSTRSKPLPIDRRIVQLGRKRKTDEALQLYQSLDHPTVRQTNAALDACARARPVRLKEALMMVDNMPTDPNVYTLGTLMNACAQAGDADRARQLLDEYAHLKPNAVVYNAAVSACAKADPPRLQMALDLLKEGPTTVVGYNAAMSAARGDWASALDLLEDMKENGPEPDAVTYATALHALSVGQEWERLLDVAEEMLQMDFPLDALALTTCLQACQHLCRADLALKYWDHYKLTPAYPKEGRTGSESLAQADAVAYRLAIAACGRGGDLDSAIRLLDEYCRDIGGDVIAYTAAIKGCDVVGDWQKAFKLLDHMRRKGIEPNEMTFNAILGACATACARNDRDRLTPHVKAMRLFQILKKDPSIVKPNVELYNAAIRVCAEAQDLTRSFVLYQEMQAANMEPSMVTFGSLMTACERVGSIDGMNRVFATMRECEVEANEIIYGAALSCCRKAGDTERAYRLFQRMLREGLNPNTATVNTVLVSLADVKATTQRVQQVMEVFRLLRSNELNAEPSRQTYTIMIRYLAIQCRSPKFAHGLLTQMRREYGWVPDVDLYTATVASYEKKGQPLEALRLMEAMRQDGYDFYSVPVLNEVFKRAVRLANAVGRGWSEEQGESELDGFNLRNGTIPVV